MMPEPKTREIIDHKLLDAGWTFQDMEQFNPLASCGVAVREFPITSGPADYALFVDHKPVGVIEAKAAHLGETRSSARPKRSAARPASFAGGSSLSPFALFIRQRTF